MIELDKNDPLYKLGFNKARRGSKDFECNVVKIEHIKGFVNNCDSINISIDNCTTSSLRLLSKLLKKETLECLDEGFNHPIQEFYTDLTGKLYIKLDEALQED